MLTNYLLFTGAMTIKTVPTNLKNKKEKLKSHLSQGLLQTIPFNCCFKSGSQQRQDKARQDNTELILICDFKLNHLKDVLKPHNVAVNTMFTYVFFFFTILAKYFEMESTFHILEFLVK